MTNMSIRAQTKKTCFIIGPIGEHGTPTRAHADWLFDLVIRPAVDDYPEFRRPIRADMMAEPGMITTQIVNLLIGSDLVIADLSMRNPNVFYEVGVRHMAQSPIIFMQLRGEPRVFDVAGFRTIEYSLEFPTQVSEAKLHLKDAIAATLSGKFRIESPITQAGVRRQHSGLTKDGDLPVMQMRVTLGKTQEEISSEGQDDHIIMSLAKIADSFRNNGVHCDYSQSDGSGRAVYLVEVFREPVELDVLAHHVWELERNPGVRSVIIRRAGEPRPSCESSDYDDSEQ